MVSHANRRNYIKSIDVNNVIRYILRENKDPKNDLITYGGVGVMECLGIESMINEFYAVQKMHTRKRDFGRYIDHEFFGFPDEAEQLIHDNVLDVDAIAREMAYDFYEKDHCQVIYGVHGPSEKTPFTHIHFSVNTVNYITGNKRRENIRQTRERQARFNKIMANAISRER